MKIEKKNKVLEAATRVFAEKGYHYATISEIVAESGYSTGLVYSYFKNKLDIFLSIVLSFLRMINQLNQEKLEDLDDPMERLTALLHNIELICNQGDNFYFMKVVVNEALPQLNVSKEKKLLDKRNEILEENTKLIKMVDEIIVDGQQKNIFDKSFNPYALRQIFTASIRTLLTGLYYQKYSKENMGFDESDVHEALTGLISKFIKK